MKDLESKLAERDAMIRVLQKHTYDKESSSSGVGGYQAAHSTHSSTSADHHTALTSTPELGESFDTIDISCTVKTRGLGPLV